LNWYRKVIALILLVLFVFVADISVVSAELNVDAQTPKVPPSAPPTATTGPKVMPTVTSEKKPQEITSWNWSDSTDKTVGVHAFVVHLKYSKADQVGPELSAVIEGNKVVVDPARNIVIVTGTYTEYQRVMELLDQLDTPPRQIMYEVEVVEVDRDDLSNLGINWGSALALPGGQLGDPSSAFQVKLGIPNHPELVANIKGTLNYLIQKQKGRLLASPRIATLDGITAHVLIGDKLAVESTQVINGASVTSVQYVDVGIKLEVTPVVNENDIITTHILPEVSNKTDTTPSGNPNIRTRQAETTIRVKSGETIVLAGLIQRQETSTALKTPLLGDLPLIGTFFRSTSKEVTETELVILLTPKIMNAQ